MASASFLQGSFLGGEWSTTVQGRVERPDYRTAMNVCLNALPIEQGAWVRRPGTQFAQTTRSGTFGREIKFEFESASPYRMEFTANHLRFRVGNLLVPEIETRTVNAQDSNSPVQITIPTATIVPFVTGDDIYFPLSTDPMIRNRLFRVTVVDQTHFTLTDPVAGTPIDGTTIEFVGSLFYRVVDFATPFGGSILPALRSVQAEKNAFLLSGQIPPQLLQVVEDPTPTLDTNGQPITASFQLAPAVFLDGPYLDPVPGGAQITPSSTSGVVTLTISFPAFSASTAYTVGSFVSSGGVDYESLVDANVGNTPASSPTQWQPVSTGIAVGPNGFTGTDIGRLIRLFSEPLPWNAATAYVIGNEVSYPNGVNGGVSYWRATANNTGVPPGTNASDWAIDANGAIWTWGKIVGLGNFISPSGSTPIGNLGVLSASFDGVVSKSAAFCSRVVTSTSPIDVFIGLQVVAPAPISGVTVYPSSDQGFAEVFVSFSGGGGTYVTPQVTINLWGSAGAPSGPENGTFLGTTGIIPNLFIPVNIKSSDNATAFNFLWIEVISVVPGAGSFSHAVQVSQVEFFGTVASGVGNAVNVEILGPSLLYTTPINVWRLGLFNNTTGYPTCGVYHEGRIWLSGVIGNRFDWSVANGVLQNGQVNMAPTNPDGSVSDSSGGNYVFNADDVNPIFWMASDQVGIVCGTQGGEWLIQASNLNSPLSPTNMQGKRFAKSRCANIEPRRTTGTLAVVQLYQEKILEYFADVFSGRLVAQNLAWKAPHLTRLKIAELAFMQERAPVIWARSIAGNLIGITYKRENLMSSQEPNFAGAHQHFLGTGRTVSGICEAATVDGSLSTVSLVTTDVNHVYHVELLSNLFLETDNPVNAWFLDDAVIPVGQVMDDTVIPPLGGVQLNGLWYLNGVTVSVFSGGLDCGDFLVADGFIQVPFGDGVAAGTAGGLFTQAFWNTNPPTVAGANYTSQGQIVRPILPAETGARNGPALGKKRRNQKYSLLVANTAELFIGTVFTKLFPVLFKSPANVSQGAGQYFTGVYHDTLNDDYSYDGMLCWEIERPVPGIIAAVEPFIQTQDE